ncbi:PIG-L deacetylase family protein [Caulobacter sp. S45]|uniref:PIG-L deacetylase family protein n=1 Tax=Caulobacter sp. S45 TaxID=1641861 RepID=UPI001575C1F9|nr:PIG-L family deacetylase [Caulobacter sp. S45]
MTRVVLALSPHLDDAVFSAGGGLAARAEAGWRVVVATLFTGGVDAPKGFALACQLDKGLGPEIDYMALRRGEDEAACAALGLHAVHLPLLEAPHRDYHSAAELFRAPHADDPAREALGPALAELIEAHGPDEVWAPRALGGHVDHVLVHRATRASASAARLCWWTDWPYADRPAPADPESPTVAALAWEDEALSAAARTRKADACAAYGSQLGFQFGGEAAMRARVRAMAAERYATARA